jgi:cytosine/adenosine deaminase-related metal-dependent hydrolase
MDTVHNGRTAHRDVEKAALLLSAAQDSTQRILIEGGWVFEPTGTFARADVTIAGSRIESVGPRLRESMGDDNVVVVEAAGHLVLPGFVDAHLHAWEGQLRGFAPGATFEQYVAIAHQRFGAAYRPEDVYAGTLMSTLQCLNAGVTGIIDNFHNHRSPAHGDAAVDALTASGIRAVLASGEPLFGEFSDWLADIPRLRAERFSSDTGLLSLRLFGTQGADPGPFRYALENDMSISTEMGSWIHSVPQLAALGLLRPEVTFNHCTDLPDDVWRLIVDNGVTVNVCPRSDSQFGLAVGEPPVDAARRHGVSPGLSMDNELAYRIDMFEEMRYLLLTQRTAAQARARSGATGPDPLLAREALTMATKGSAVNAGWSGITGAIQPGLQADVILLDLSRFGTAPLNNLYAQAVNFGSPAAIDAVFVAGRVRKWGMDLVGVDLQRAADAAARSTEHLIRAAGLDVDVFALEHDLWVERTSRQTEINDVVDSVKGL